MINNSPQAMGDEDVEGPLVRKMLQSFFAYIFFFLFSFEYGGLYEIVSNTESIIA